MRRGGGQSDGCRSCVATTIIVCGHYVATVFVDDALEEPAGPVSLAKPKSRIAQIAGALDDALAFGVEHQLPILIRTGYLTLLVHLALHRNHKCLHAKLATTAAISRLASKSVQCQA